jgi:hypothetical protein
MTDYLLNFLSGSQEELVDTFNKFKKSNEFLYRGTISKEDLEFSSAREIYEDIEKYFNTEFEKEYHPIPYSLTFKTFVKMCWLTDMYFSEGIRNPLGVHYNPRLGKNIIHPGRARQAVYSLFHEGPVDVIYFNTGGITPPWPNPLQQIEIDSFLNTGGYIALVPDHGSIIPHIHYEQHLLTDMVTEYHTRIRNRFNNNFSIRSNVDIELLRKWKTSLKPVVDITFSNNFDFKDVVKSIFIITLGLPYTSDKFKIIYNS